MIFQPLHQGPVGGRGHLALALLALCSESPVIKVCVGGTASGGHPKGRQGTLEVHPVDSVSGDWLWLGRVVGFVVFLVYLVQGGEWDMW